MADAVEARQADPVDWTNYDDGGAGKPLPPKGEYELETVTVKKERNKQGYLQMVADVKVIAPGQPFDGYLSRFNNFNTQKWPNRNGNGLADYLRGHGMAGPFNTDEEYEAAAMATVGRRFRGGVDWRVYDSATGFTVAKYEDFPTDASGRKATKVEHNSQTFFANVKVKYVVSQVKR